MPDVIDEAHGVARGTVTPPVAAPAPFRSRGALEYELKFGMEHRSVVALRRWLGAMCLPDPRFPIGTVCSIYYDTPGFHHLRENFNGDYLKSKVRLRWYLDHVGRSGRSFLEAKFRHGGRRDKIRLEVPYEGAWLAGIPLHTAALRSIPLRLRAKGVPTSAALRPVILVRYVRDRFVEPLTGVRISLDSEISAPAVNRDVIPTPNPQPLPTVIVEVKGAVNGLPEVLQPLLCLGARRRSFSKYAACYEHTVQVRP